MRVSMLHVFYLFIEGMTKSRLTLVRLGGVGLKKSILLDNGTSTGVLYSLESECPTV
jgi:hypothetical protein